MVPNALENRFDCLYRIFQVFLSKNEETSTEYPWPIQESKYCSYLNLWPAATF